MSFDFNRLPANLQNAINGTIKREGGYVNHKADKGGPTNHGVTLKTLRTFRKNSKLKAQDVKDLTVDEAREIYYKMYMEEYNLHWIKDPFLQEFMFDFTIHSGADDSVPALQRRLNALGGSKVLPLKVDGLFGPLTNRALNECLVSPKVLVQHLVDDRILFLAGIVRSTPSQAAFIVGWINRCLKFRRY